MSAPRAISFTLNGVPTTLVGIMPKRFTKLNADLWQPVALNRADPALRDEYFMFQARLKPTRRMVPRYSVKIWSKP